MSHPDLIDLARGYPTPALLPVDEIRACVGRISDERARAMLAYGPGGGPPATRDGLARFLAARYQHPVSADEIALAGGISLSLSMVCQLLAPPGSTVVCEDPTYFHASNVLRTAAVEVHAVPVDADGMRVDLLERALESGLMPRMVYCIPTFHNPTNVTLSAARARRLLELAQAHDFLVVADEPYNLLHFDDGPPRCMMSYADDDEGAGRVISLGSFSKLVAPGLRTGWVHAHPGFIDRFLGHGALLSGGGLNGPGFAIVEDMLDSGFLAANIEKLRAVYGERARIMAAGLSEHFGADAFHELRGGYFAWLALPPGVSLEPLLAAAEERGVRVMPGPRCALDMDASGFVRLCFAYQPRERMREGIERLARAVRAVA